MKHIAVNQVLQRAELAKTDSDFTYFFSLLIAGEAIVKITTLGYLAAIGDDKDRNRYRLEHALARSSGLGDWSKAIEDALTGPASQFLLTDARPEHGELTRLSRPGDWQYESVIALRAALVHLKIDAEDVPAKSDMKRWFRLFTTLRNKTRAHGATQPAASGPAAEHLAKSIDLFFSNHGLFKRPWAYLYRNFSGKYRVSEISESVGAFDSLKRGSQKAFKNGVYIHFGEPRLVPLMHSEPELQDFYFANGGLAGKSFELLSYYTDSKINGDATLYQVPPGTLPPSETEGHGELSILGNCFTNVPELPRDYVSRPELEENLYKLLLDEKRTIITLLGRGGIGKTSLVLKVIPRLYGNKEYDAVVWFSARDVDLKLAGPKPVRPLVLSPEDMSRYYVSLVCPEKLEDKNFKPRTFFEGQLQKSELGVCLFVFDNFETTQNPADMFTWVDTFVRPPNKVLITTRLRDFKGDYPLEVSGMNDEEARELVKLTASQLSITGLLNQQYTDDLIEESGGHPYIIKILLGEVARSGRIGSIPQIVAGSDEILTALFERTYASLSPCAQRTFMTLAAWNSSVPLVALQAVLLRSIGERVEVDKGIESLLQFSLAETHVAPTDKMEFIGLPLVASLFGKKKLNISPFSAAVQADVEILQMLGPSRRNDIHLGLARRLETFMANLSRRIDKGEPFENFEAILEMICRAYNPGWLLLARLHFEAGTNEHLQKSADAVRLYLEEDPTNADAWRLLARVCYRTGDTLGEIHAFVMRAQIPSVSFYEISSTANRLNELLHDQVLAIPFEGKRELVQKIMDVLDKRKGEADADDFSRMAWLAFHLGNESRAREYVEAGLAIDSENYHCLRLSERIASKVF